MKNLQIFTLSLLALFFMQADVQAQTPMQQGVSVAQVGVGIGGWGWGSSLYGNVTPLLSAGYELGIVDDLGPGNLAVGAIAGYRSAKYYNTSIYNWRYSWTYGAVRASWHPHFVDSDELDVYIALNLGLYFFNVNGDGILVDNSSVSVLYAGTLGARYFFTESIGAWAEIGAGLAWLNAGICAKF